MCVLGERIPKVSGQGRRTLQHWWAHGCYGAILQVARGGGGGYSFRLPCAECGAVCCVCCSVLCVLLMDVMVRSYKSLEEEEEAILSGCSVLRVFQCVAVCCSWMWWCDPTCRSRRRRRPFLQVAVCCSARRPCRLTFGTLFNYTNTHGTLAVRGHTTSVVCT